MTAFTDLVKKFTQRPVTLVELPIPFCSLRYGSGICAPDSRELFDFESSAGWTPSADAELAPDNTWSLRGVRSMKIDKTGTSSTLVLASRADLVDIGDLTGKKLRIAYNLGAALIAVAGSPGLVLRLGDDVSNYRDWYLAPGGLVTGLNLFQVEFDTPAATVGTPSAEPVYMAVGAYTALAGDTFSDALSVDDLIEINDTPQAFPCYNVRATCRDPGHFFTQKTSKTFRFSGEEAPIVAGLPGPPAIQAIRSRGIKLIPTKIDLERGYGRRDQLQVTLTDFLDDDRFTDPYRDIRSSAPASTFFRKFVARNPYLKNRPIFLREGLGIDDPETGKVTVDLDEFQTRHYVIDRIEGPNKQGQLVIVAKDVLKELDAHQVPQPSDAQVNATNPINLSQTTIELTEGSVDNLLAQWIAAGFSLPNGMFYVRMGDELMLVTSAVEGGLNIEVVRAQLGSEPEEHDPETKVQLVQSWIDVRIDEIWYDIQIQSGVDPSLIGYSDAQNEADFFLAEYTLTAHISEPTKSADLMKDLNLQSGTFTWWDSEDQLTRFKPTRPPAPGDTVARFSDESEIVADSVDIKRREELRITNAFIYFDPINWAGDLRKPGNYRQGILFIDADAEGEDQYDDQKNRTFLSYFYPSGSASIVRATAARYVQKFRDPPKAIKVRVTSKDAAFVKPGDFVNLSTFGLVDFDGRPIDTQTLAISKNRVDGFGIVWEYDLDEYEFVAGKYAFWAPDDAPDLSAATPQDLLYAYWAGSNCLLPDGSPPYLWV